MSKVIFHRSGKGAPAGCLRESCSALLIFLCYKSCVISDRIGDFVRDKILDIYKRQEAY